MLFVLSLFSLFGSRSCPFAAVATSTLLPTVRAWLDSNLVPGLAENEDAPALTTKEEEEQGQEREERGVAVDANVVSASPATASFPLSLTAFPPSALAWIYSNLIPGSLEDEDVPAWQTEVEEERGGEGIAVKAISIPALPTIALAPVDAIAIVSSCVLERSYPSCPR